MTNISFSFITTKTSFIGDVCFYTYSLSESSAGASERGSKNWPLNFSEPVDFLSFWVGVWIGEAL